MTKIEKAIRYEFPGATNRGLRKRVREAAASGDPGVVLGLASSIALSPGGKQSLKAIAEAMDRQLTAVEQEIE
jgi:hypothetical protein